ncbi:unnamed protein product [Meloidogyne enterolobii]|uniref:Uncharacterized protein n=1 Tax=Meloidogyne enterolobii TaxID=390850 RepID=A0ACB0XK52_MELEN
MRRRPVTTTTRRRTVTAVCWGIVGWLVLLLKILCDLGLLPLYHKPPRRRCEQSWGE